MRQITKNIFLLCLIGAWCAPASAQYGVGDRWWMCPSDRALPPRPLYQERVEAGSTEIRADTTRIVRDGVTEFAGDVEVVRDGRSISGDVVTYDRANAEVEVQGSATIWDPGVIWQGEHALFDLDSDVGRLESGNYWLVNGRGRGVAGVFESDRVENISLLEQVDYTTCAAADPTWRFSARNIRLDHDAGRGSATNALLKVRDVPVFYFPYISFPLNNERKSGFLIPTIGSSNESGFDITVPYYFNIAPNHDATFKPRLLDSRGVMLGGEYRYLTEQHEGKLGVEYMPSDNLANNRARSLISFRHLFNFHDERGRLRANIENVSDAQYFEDFGRSLSVTSQRFLDRRIDVRYRRWQKYVFTGTVQSYQTVDDSRDNVRGPYKRIPQFAFRTLLPEQHLKLNPQIAIQTTYFDRNNSITGGRLDVTPSISFPYILPHARIIPRFSIRHTDYFLKDTGRFDDHEARTVPIVSLDSRLFAERRMSLFGRAALQTLEPRIFYLYVPENDQDDIPVFDSGLYTTSFQNLFRDNRFVGRDRVGDANQVTLAATTRFIDLRTGRELLRASLGQTYHFEDRNVTLPNRRVENEDVSELIGELAATFGRGWSARAVVQYDPNNSTMERASYHVRYRPEGTGIIVNAGYRRRQALTDIEQTDLSFRIPVTSALSLLGRWNYSLENNRSLELVGGMEYEGCCWGARLVGRRFIRNTAGAFDTGIFMQVEFKGLAGYGGSAASFLRKRIPGYEEYF